MNTTHRTRFAQHLRDIEHTVRGSFFGFSAMLPLLAAGTVDPHVGFAKIAGFLVVAANVHVFGYLHNDLVDLPIDRTHPERAADPLVRGALSSAHVRGLVAAQVPISVAAVWAMGGRVDSILVLAVTYAATVAYNVYGKRCPVPPLTDAIQGVAWFGLAAVGAVAMGDFNALSFVVAFFGFAFIFLINGVHGGLRDIHNDLARRCTTTAIYFGARPIDANHAHSPPALQGFASFAFALIVVPSTVCLATNALGHDASTRATIAAAWILLNATSAWYLWQVIRPHQMDRRRWIYAHQMPLLAPPLVLFLPAFGWPLRTAVLMTWAVTLLLFSEPVHRRLASIGTLWHHWTRRAA